MPRKTKGKRGKSREPKMNDVRDKVVRVPFHIFQTNTGSTAYQIILYPTSFQRELTVADAFEQYRFTELMFRIIPSSTGVGAVAGGYLPGITDNAPASVGAIGGILKSVMIGATQSVPSAWCKLSLAELKSQLNWYKTIPGTPDPMDEQQGTVFFVSESTSVTFFIEMAGICEFRGAAPTGSTPQSRLEAMYAKEYKRMTAILAAGGHIPSAKLPVPKCSPPTG